nr:SgcJ/EcaC family oxidoreductase [Paludisphaera mucosa]
MALCAGPEVGAQVAAGPTSKTAAEAEIRAFDAAFVDWYNKGDAKALASLYTEDADVFEADGARYRGRDLIERSYTETIAAQKGAKLTLEIESIRPLSADVVKEEGRSLTTLATGAVVPRFYTALFVKSDGRWLIASVREETDSLVRPHDRLKELDWLIGDWVAAGTELDAQVHGGWSADGNFLILDYSVKRGVKPMMQVTQRVGWDAVASQFHSWEFDSEGGFGEGIWSRDGERWVVKQTGVRPEGVTASSTRILTRKRAYLVSLLVTDQVVGGVAIPGEERSALTRVPPVPQLGAGPPRPINEKSPQ